MEFKNLIIYPYKKSLYPIVRLLLDNNVKISILDTKESATVLRDINYLVNKSYETSISIENIEDYRNKQKADILMPEINTINNLIYSNLSIILRSGTVNKIYSLIKDNNNIKNYIDNVEIISLYRNTTINSINRLYEIIKNQSRVCSQPKIPVIYVGGVIDNMDNSYIAITLKEELKKMGYKVDCISNDINTRFLECISFPEDFFDDMIPLELKIKYFNYYINACIETLKLDVIIIQLPYGVIKYNDVHTNTFGVFSYMISQAINCDYFVCNIPINFYSITYYNLLSDYFYKKYNCVINALHISNNIINFDNNIPNNYNIIYEKEEIVDSYIHENRDEFKKIFNCYNKKDKEWLIEDLLNTLI